MNYSILDATGNEVAIASGACEARDKFRRGVCVFGKQTIVDKTGAHISEAELESLCAREATAENAFA
jgi:hypothetical protein